MVVHEDITVQSFPDVNGAYLAAVTALQDNGVRLPASRLAEHKLLFGLGYEFAQARIHGMAVSSGWQWVCERLETQSKTFKATPRGIDFEI